MAYRQWFTSDTHFGHANIIRHCRRPFASVEAMDRTLIEKWNAVVGDEDVVYHLGDFTWESDLRKLCRLRAHLNGRIHLVPGNHDHVQQLLALGIIDELLPGLHELIVKDESSGARVRVVLCHYPLEEWNCSYRGALHLHGHTHGQLAPAPGMRRLDVGVDAHGFAPVSLRTVLNLQQISVDRRSNFQENQQ